MKLESERQNLFKKFKFLDEQLSEIRVDLTDYTPSKSLKRDPSELVLEVDEVVEESSKLKIKYEDDLFS